MYFSRYSDKFTNFITTILPFIGLLLILLAISLMWYWESAGREKYLYTNAVVLNENVKKGEKINNSLLVYKSFEKTKLINSVITNPQEIIDKQAKHFIPSGIQLHNQFFETSELLLKGDELLFQISNKWIVSIPNSIRRNDKVLLIPFNESVKDNTSYIETTVAYVKDNANREIVSVGENERYNGTSKISNIEIIVSLNQFKKLIKHISDGNKFIILFKESGA